MTKIDAILRVVHLKKLDSCLRMQLNAVMAIAAILGLMVLSPIVVQASSDNPTPGDSVVGEGTAGFGTFTINAYSGPLGQNPFGTVSFNLAIGTIEGSVTKLCVTSNQAVIAGEVSDGSTAAQPGSGFFLHVQDNGQLPSGIDLMRLELVSFVPTFCTDFNLISPAEVTQGDIAITDIEDPCMRLKTSDLPSDTSNPALEKVCSTT